MILHLERSRDPHLQIIIYHGSQTKQKSQSFNTHMKKQKLSQTRSTEWNQMIPYLTENLEPSIPDNMSSIAQPVRQ